MKKMKKMENKAYIIVALITITALSIGLALSKDIEIESAGSNELIREYALPFVNVDFVADKIMEGNINVDYNPVIKKGRISDGGFFTAISEELQAWADNDVIELPANFGLEKKFMLKEYGLDKLDLEKNEQVLIFNVYDVDICDYVELEVYTCDEKININVYYAILDRENNIVACKKEFQSNYSDSIDELKEQVDEGFKDWYIEFFEPPVTIANSYDELENLWINKKIYLVQENNFIDGHTWDNSEEEIKIVKDTKTGMEQKEESAKIEWRMNSFNIDNIPFSDRINGEIKKEMDKELQRCISVCDVYLENQKEELLELASWKIDIEIDEEIVYQDEEYLAIAITINCFRSWEGSTPKTPYSYHILSFDLKTGEKLSLEKYIGSDYVEQDIKQLAWIGYQKLMEKVPDKYSKNVFDQFYDGYYKADYRLLWWESGLNDIYYFSKEGIVFYYDYSWTDLPVRYQLDQHLLWEWKLEVPVTYEELEEYRSKRGK